MDFSSPAVTWQQLLAELDIVERAIARGTTFVRWEDASGRTGVRVSSELMALAEREQLIVGELRRRRRETAGALLEPA